MDWEEDLTDEHKKDGFIGERLIIPAIEAFSDYMENPQVRRLYLTDVGYFPRAINHYRERKEGIGEYIFFYCTGGKGFIWVNDREYVLKENEAFCIPRFQSHCYYADKEDPWSILWVHFKGEDTQYYPLEECRVISFESAQITDHMQFLFELLFQVLGCNYTLGNFIYISQVLSLILAEAYVREKSSEAKGQNRHVTAIIKYMYRNIGKNLTLGDLSDVFGLSKSYINAIFLKNTQHSPVDFFIRLKMQEACKRLRDSEVYIYEVAQAVGYQDPYYFSRIFKKIVGVSPKEYKNNAFFFWNKWNIVHYFGRYDICCYRKLYYNQVK